MSAILTLNAGSSSLKFALYRPGAEPEELGRGQVENIGAAARLVASASTGQHESREIGHVDHAQALGVVLERAAAWFDGLDMVAVGHRITHGGTEFGAPCELTDGALAKIEKLTPLAPLHQPHNLAAVAAARKAFPKARQIGCFDTAFHRGHAWVTETFALPRHFYDEGVRRYGFHGLSYEYVSGELQRIAPEIAAGKVVIAHLGAGASMCALQSGRSVESSMGFSALDGLPMGTRCGQIDPGVLLYLMDAKQMSKDDISHLLYCESGLVGLSGVSNDVRTLEGSNAIEAQQALDYFAFRIRREVGAMAAALGGVDALVFCAGVGENSARVRGDVCDGLGWLGFSLNDAKNQANAQRIEAGGKPIFVIRTSEERVIARAVARLLSA